VSSNISGGARFVFLQQIRPLFTFSLLTWRNGTQLPVTARISLILTSFTALVTGAAPAADVIRLALGTAFSCVQERASPVQSSYMGHSNGSNTRLLCLIFAARLRTKLTN
jgi:hypothetical protein